MSTVTIPAGYRGTLNAASNTRYVGQNGATVTAAIGVALSTGDSDVEFIGIAFRGQGEAGDGIHAVTRGVKRIRFVDCTFDNFRAGGTFHHSSEKGVADAEWSRDIEFIRCRFTNMAGRGDKSGHGILAQHVDGLTFDGCLIDGAGMANSVRKIWVHGLYIGAGCRRVVVRNTIVNNSESVGLQLRGPLLSTTDADNGDTPLIENVLTVDNPIGVLVNGPRATIRGLLAVVGPHHAGPGTTTSGENAVYASVGKLSLDNVLVVRGMTDYPGEDIKPVLNNPRPQKDTYADKTLKRWEWNKPTSTEGTADVRLDKRVDLSDLIDRARKGEPVGPLIAAAWGRAKGVPTPPPVLDVPAPTGLRLKSENTERGLEWEWSGVLGATAYNVYRDGLKVGQSANAHEFSGKVPGTYTVTALRGAVEGPHSAGVKWGAVPPPPDPKAELKRELAELEAKLIAIAQQQTALDRQRDAVNARREVVLGEIG